MTVMRMILEAFQAIVDRGAGYTSDSRDARYQGTPGSEGWLERLAVCAEWCPTGNLGDILR